MKKKLLSIVLLFALFISLFSASGVQAAAKPKLNKRKVVLEVDAKITLKLGDIVSTDVKWKSSNKKVATVTSKGVVTAKGEGSATITATYNKKGYTCKVTVIDSSPEFSSVNEYVDAQKDDIEEAKESLKGTGLSVEVFADDDTLVYKYIYDVAMPVTKAVKKQFDANVESLKMQFDVVIAEMEELVDVDNPKVKLIYENLDGTVVYEHTFE